MKGALKSRVDGEVPTAHGLIDDGPDLPRPGVERVGGPLITDLGRETESNGEMPALRRPDPRANVVSDPLDSVSVLFAGEDIEADL